MRRRCGTGRLLSSGCGSRSSSGYADELGCYRFLDSGDHFALLGARFSVCCDLVHVGYAIQVNATFRVLILIVWLIPMLLGALACLLTTGLSVGWQIMAEWIEVVEP